MCITPKKLGEAELEIMQVIWNSDGPVTSNFILKELQGKRKWQLSTLMTSLTRLSDKGFVCCDRSAGCNLYLRLLGKMNIKAGQADIFWKSCTTIRFKIWLLRFIAVKRLKILMWKNSGTFWMSWKRNIPGRMSADGDKSVSFHS